VKAVQYRSFGAGPEVVMIEKPSPGPGEILLKVTASGLCHSDEILMSMSPDKYDKYRFAIPQTLGHEPAGIVDELGAGVAGIEVGTPVIVYGCWGCGLCEMCADGSENLCLRGMTAPGLGQPGAMAEYMLVDSVRHLVPIGDLAPVAAASLADAGLTPYQAIRSMVHRLAGGSTAVVIGAGGLGHVAIQLLRTLTATRVVALDVTEDKLALAQRMGAHDALISDRNAPSAIKRITSGRGADVVFDFVGTDATGKLAMMSCSPGASVVLLGAGGGGVHSQFSRGPANVSVSTSLWGRRKQLFELVTMAQRGQIEIQTQCFSLDDTPKAYFLLKQGQILGRAVVVPSSDVPSSEPSAE